MTEKITIIITSEDHPINPVIFKLHGRKYKIIIEDYEDE